jgi:hypothetical protein
MKLQSSISLVVALLLGACGTQPQQDVVQTAPLASNMGCVVSVLVDQRSGSRKFMTAAKYSQGILNTSTTRRNALPFERIKDGPRNKSLSEGDNDVFYYVMIVPAGTHFISDYYVFHARLGGNRWATPKSFKVPFTVEQGRCTYLGRSVLHPSEYLVSWVSKLEQDSAAVESLLPTELKGKPLIAIPSFSIPPLGDIE